MIGIIVAEDAEFLEIHKFLKDEKIEEFYSNKFFSGTINNKECVITKCGVGKVNAARCTQLLIDKFNPQYIINIGVAGGISDRLKIGDIVIAEKLVQYDVDITAFGREKGELPEGIGKFIYSNKDLLEKAENIINKLPNLSGIIGTIATGDSFIASNEISKNIYNEFGADAVEMEGASVAQVCLLDGVPFIVIRSISDVPNNNNKVDFDKFLSEASKNIAEFIFFYTK